MKVVRSGFCLMLLIGCGGRSFGPDHPATVEEQANAQAATSSLTTFNADAIDVDAFAGMASAVYGVANSSYATSAVLRPRATYTDCATVSADRIDYNCTITDTTSTSTSTTTLTGYVSRTISGDSRSWHMDLKLSTSDTSPGTSINVSMHLTGNVTVAGGVIDGSLGLGATVHVMNGSQTVDGTVNASVSYNKVTYDATQSCATGGNIVVDLDANANGQSVSRAVRYTFTGCHMITVAVSN